MLDFDALTLFLYISARMSGFVLFNPIFGRGGLPGLFKAGLILTLSISVYGTQAQAVPVPESLLELSLRLFLELGAGLLVGFIMRFFFFIPEEAGEIVDTQMGMSMGRTYDPGAQASMTNTSNLLNAMMVLIFFACNGHITLLRILCTSGEIIPFGRAALGDAAANRAVELFAQCALLGLKLSFPILAAELMGQIGMGVLMKVIPQINVFVINIELKVIIGLAMLLLLLPVMGDFLLEMENSMLTQLRLALDLAHETVLP